LSLRRSQARRASARAAAPPSGTPRKTAGAASSRAQPCIVTSGQISAPHLVNLKSEIQQRKIEKRKTQIC
jgi:hypothetical protein